MSLALLELLCAAPPTSPPSPRQLEVLGVLADAWAEASRPEGIALLEHLQGRTPTEERCRELGVEPWFGDARGFAMSAMPELADLVSHVAAQSSADDCFRLLAWLGTSPVGAPLHGRVSDLLCGFLLAVERRELPVAREPLGPPFHCRGFRLGNDWLLDVFYRGRSFWRVDCVINPDGFSLDLIDFHDGPLAELNDYEPPPDVEEQVYGRDS